MLLFLLRELFLVVDVFFANLPYFSAIFFCRVGGV